MVSWKNPPFRFMTYFLSFFRVAHKFQLIIIDVKLNHGDIWCSLIKVSVRSLIMIVINLSWTFLVSVILAVTCAFMFMFILTLAMCMLSYDEQVYNICVGFRDNKLLGSVLGKYVIYDRWQLYHWFHTVGLA